MTAKNSSGPLVSIIVRTKDRPKLLGRALRSISDQTYRPLEAVVVNDGGCALNEEELAGNLNDVSLRYLPLEENVGRAMAGNVGVENANGKYLGFLDDDDEFLPEHVATLAGFLTQSDLKIAYADSLLVFTEYDTLFQEIREVGKELAFSEEFDYDKLVFENYIPLMCLLFDRKTILDVGGFDPTFELYEDWDMLIRLGERNVFQHIRRVTAKYYQWNADLQISQRNKDQDLLREAYVSVLRKHFEKITARRVHLHVGAAARGRFQLADLTQQLQNAVKAQEDYGKRLEGALVRLREKDEEIARQNATVESFAKGLRDKDAHIAMLEEIVGKKDDMIDDFSRVAEQREGRIAVLENTVRERDEYISVIHSGRAWRLMSKYYKLRDRLLPSGTRRRLFVKLFLRMLRNPREVFASLKKRNVERFLYYLKVSDAITLEKRIEQKLTGVIDALSKEAGGGECLVPGPDDTGERGAVSVETSWGCSRDWVPLSNPSIPDTQIRPIAFYLPQFHPIKENDEWWGKGFTEWTNVTRAVPQFKGHYQPRLPGELGFYDLRIPEVQERQVELARQYGIHGFCFHFYWFHGETLLEGPVRSFADRFDFPFCLNWANENWTRTWDGEDHQVLVGQEHSPEDDIAFIEHVAYYLNKENYIRIGGRPLLLVYRPALFPDPKGTVARWRAWCRDNGIGEIYLALTHSFEQLDPRSLGFDAAVEFAPNRFPLTDIVRSCTLYNRNFKGVVLDYQEAVEFSERFEKPPYTKFRGICPGWDNDARKPGRGTVLANASPQHFARWLKTLLSYTEENLPPEERLVFVNAWNEWAEGAYLEPDRRYGYGYLQAVANTLIDFELGKKRKKLIYVCHDALFHGAQLLSLHMVRMLKLKFRYDVHIVLKAGGVLEDEFRKWGTVYNLERDFRSEKEQKTLVGKLAASGVDAAICNTTGSGDLVGLLSQNGVRVVSLVHELPEIIRQKNLEGNARQLARYSDRIVFASEFVRDRYRAVAEFDDEKTRILPQGLYKTNALKDERDTAREMLRKRYDIREEARIVLGVGYGDHRKGIDLFLEVARTVAAETEEVSFLWLGNIEPALRTQVREEAEKIGNVILQDAVTDVSMYYAGADLYLLTSREDPFPTVVLEAMEVGLPVVGFEDAGGFSDIVTADTGGLVPQFDTKAMSAKVLAMLEDGEGLREIEARAREIVERRFNFTDYVYALLSLLGHDYRKVSVVVPNYNYAHHLPQRLETVVNQTYPVYELIFLDDASTDNSLAVAEPYLSRDLNHRIIRNETNSGSVFRQWLRGLDRARGELVWIAEADDFSDGRFLETTVQRFERDSDVVLAYTQSRQVDADGRLLDDNYLEYTNDIDRTKWTADYVRPGIDEISDTLAVKNTIPNVSAVVFKKLDVSEIAETLISHKGTGDWFFYVWLLRHGKVAFVSEALNSHRRHDSGVTLGRDNEGHYEEILAMQDFVMANYPVGEEARRKIEVYRAVLRDYFGLEVT